MDSMEPICTTTEDQDRLIETIKNKQDQVYAWLEGHEKKILPPLYSSIDLRDAGFKMAVVDTNLFPAGFNNLCEHGLLDSVAFFRSAIFKRVPDCKKILILAEEHTRNTWYLENVRILQQVIEQAGFDVKIATFLTIQPAFCQDVNFIELMTATNHPVRIHCFKRILQMIEQGQEKIDLIIMNNDLITGIPENLRNSKIPIYPSIHAGWHSRLKSHHFNHTGELMEEFAKIIGQDPWIFSTLYAVVDQVDINRPEDRSRIQDIATTLLKRIEEKYREHGIKEKPYLVIKADAGTYGMGVSTIENPKDLLEMNRKTRNKLYKGKSAKIIERYLIQEGIPTIHEVDQHPSEVCIYQIETNLIGGFYRTHPGKTDREILNSQGMEFKKMCPHLKKYGDCGVHHDLNIFDVYRILARIAAIATRLEINELEAKSS
ncbi:MAG: glutamate--cysteine ligase [Candidatus Omnitrophica bacterium]|nr:glutamate--cysteine ligase [Candidatus Omnitrophota bacterium]